jgi:hypothetical protein
VIALNWNVDLEMNCVLTFVCFQELESLSGLVLHLLLFTEPVRMVRVPIANCLTILDIVWGA